MRATFFEIPAKIVETVLNSIRDNKVDFCFMICERTTEINVKTTEVHGSPEAVMAFIGAMSSLDEDLVVPLISLR